MKISKVFFFVFLILSNEIYFTKAICSTPSIKRDQYNLYGIIERGDLQMGEKQIPEENKKIDAYTFNGIVNIFNNWMMEMVDATVKEQLHKMKRIEYLGLFDAFHKVKSLLGYETEDNSFSEFTDTTDSVFSQYDLDEEDLKEAKEQLKALSDKNEMDFKKSLENVKSIKQKIHDDVKSKTKTAAKAVGTAGAVIEGSLAAYHTAKEIKKGVKILTAVGKGIATVATSSATAAVAFTGIGIILLVAVGYYLKNVYDTNSENEKYINEAKLRALRTKELIRQISRKNKEGSWIGNTILLTASSTEDDCHLSNSEHRNLKEVEYANYDEVFYNMAEMSCKLRNCSSESEKQNCMNTLQRIAICRYEGKKFSECERDTKTCQFPYVK